MKQRDPNIDGLLSKIRKVIASDSNSLSNCIDEDTSIRHFMDKDKEIEYAIKMIKEAEERRTYKTKKWNFTKEEAIKKVTEEQENSFIYT